MENFDFKNVEDGYYRIKSNGMNLSLWVRDGTITEINVHGETPEVNIYTEAKVSKKTKKLTMSADQSTPGYEFKVVQLKVGE